MGHVGRLQAAAVPDQFVHQPDREDGDDGENRDSHHEVQRGPDDDLAERVAVVRFLVEVEQQECEDHDGHEDRKRQPRAEFLPDADVATGARCGATARRTATTAPGGQEVRDRGRDDVLPEPAPLEDGDLTREEPGSDGDGEQHHDDGRDVEQAADTGPEVAESGGDLPDVDRDRDHDQHEKDRQFEQHVGRGLGPRRVQCSVRDS